MRKITFLFMFVISLYSTAFAATSIVDACNANIQCAGKTRITDEGQLQRCNGNDWIDIMSLNPPPPEYPFIPPSITLNPGETYCGGKIDSDGMGIVWDTPGTYELIVPENITSVSAVVVGAGGSGSPDDGHGSRNNGGGGGGLAWANAIPVVTGDTLTIKVGQGGVNYSVYGSATPGQAGGESYFINSSTLRAAGGKGATLTSNIALGGGYRTNLPNSGGHSGGNGSLRGGGMGGAGGGGAGGYSGNGGDGGGYNTQLDGSPGKGGGGGGGGASSGSFCYTNQGASGGGGGGGVGLYGEGTSGQGGVASSRNTPTGGGAGGSNGDSGENGRLARHGGSGGGYGGGGGGGSYCSGSRGGFGADGAVRIMWGEGRSFPDNAGLLE